MELDQKSLGHVILEDSRDIITTHPSSPVNLKLDPSMEKLKLRKRKTLVEAMAEIKKGVNTSRNKDLDVVDET